MRFIKCHLILKCLLLFFFGQYCLTSFFSGLFIKVTLWLECRVIELQILSRHKEFMDFHQTGFIYNDVHSERPEDPVIFHSRVLIISQAFRSFNWQTIQNKTRKLCWQVVFYAEKMWFFLFCFVLQTRIITNVWFSGGRWQPMPLKMLM